MTSFVNNARPVRAWEAQRRTISGWLLLSLMWPRIRVEVLVSRSSRMNEQATSFDRWPLRPSTRCFTDQG